MAFLLTPNTRSTAFPQPSGTPTINATNPLSWGLSIAVSPVGYTVAPTVIRGVPTAQPVLAADPAATYPTFPVVSTPYGIGRALPITNFVWGYSSSADVPALTTIGTSIFVRVVPNPSDGSNFTRIWAWTQSGTAYGGERLSLGVSGTGSVYVMSAAFGKVTLAAISDPVLNIVVCIPDTGTAGYVYINGRYYALPGWVMASLTGTATSLYYGRSTAAGAVDAGLLAVTMELMQWRRGLTPTEAYSMTTNPYQILSQGNRALWQYPAPIGVEALSGIPVTSATGVLKFGRPITSVAATSTVGTAIGSIAQPLSSAYVSTFTGSLYNYPLTGIPASAQTGNVVATYTDHISSVSASVALHSVTSNMTYAWDVPIYGVSLSALATSPIAGNISSVSGDLATVQQEPLVAEFPYPATGFSVSGNVGSLAVGTRFVPLAGSYSLLSSGNASPTYYMALEGSQVLGRTSYGSTDFGVSVSGIQMRVKGGVSHGTGKLDDISYDGVDWHVVTFVANPRTTVTSAGQPFRIKRASLS